MNPEEVLRQLAEGTTLEGPHWTEPVRVLTAKARGTPHRGPGGRPEHQTALDETAQGRRLQRLRQGHASGAARRPRRQSDALPPCRRGHRIRLAFQYDPHFAVSVSQVDPLPHQMDAVYTHLLTQPRIRFLIADDPGAGKTIMGGLLVKELKFRGLAERIDFVTPANLTDQWRRELHEKFSESFTVINRGTVNFTYGRNVWEDSFCPSAPMDVSQRHLKARFRCGA